MPEQSSKPATKHIGEEAEEELASLAPEGRRIIAAVAMNDYEHHARLGNAVIERGPRFKVKGLPGSVTETRIYYSTSHISQMLFPQTTASRAVEHLDPGRVLEMQMTPIWHQIPMGPASSLVGAPEIEAAFGMSSSMR